MRTSVSALPSSSFQTPSAHHSTDDSLPLSMPTASLYRHPDYTPTIIILQLLNNLVQYPRLPSAMHLSVWSRQLTHAPSRPHSQVASPTSDLSTAQRRACCSITLGSSPCLPFPFQSQQTSSFRIAATLSGVGSVEMNGCEEFLEATCTDSLHVSGVHIRSTYRLRLDDSPLRSGLQ